MHGTLHSADFERRRLVDDRGNEWGLHRLRDQSRSFGKAFAVIFADACEALALSGQELRPTSWRVIMLALHRLEFERPRKVWVGEWAEFLGVTPSAVSKALHQLVAAGWLDGSTRRGYVLSPRLGWRGTPGQYHARLRAMEQAADAAVLAAMGADPGTGEIAGVERPAR